MSSTELERLGDLLKRLSVAHHIEGRARLKLNGKIPAWISGETVNRYMKSIKGVTGVSVNPFSASAVVTYDKNELSPTLFEALAKGDYEPILETARSL
ncbi:MAG: heavy-metal-associated domain-containing protein [Helicobacteraceae bacterium]|jgi:hypothetical protein|nr:heavy-metal-associated domain-containing protein [Helicobacteraceae bacterium]